MDVDSTAAAVAAAAAAAIAAAPEQDRQKILEEWQADFQPLWRSAAAAQQQGAQQLWQVRRNSVSSPAADSMSGTWPAYSPKLLTAVVKTAPTVLFLCPPAVPSSVLALSMRAVQYSRPELSTSRGCL